MTQALPPPHRKVSLRLAPGGGASPPSMPPEALDQLLARARALGIPLHHDAQVAALLAALRMRPDVPGELYAAAAAVLNSIYRAAE
ncbi:flagellar biosynthesis protein [Dyella sp. BiH032]|uniref:flagellar biosynthesis protein n=1 Tax=Dyella sp. BiH032 TaxID=3075430 RepID=UPI0028932FF9|nr:flagellar biosynthesis protein [Dyella sp. BiH032]WNL47282.1 flagellar biosynthesis protein [Dyella sp. BiH032]